MTSEPLGDARLLVEQALRPERMMLRLGSEHGSHVCDDELRDPTSVPMIQQPSCAEPRESATTQVQAASDRNPREYLADESVHRESLLTERHEDRCG